ncbi:MAG: shikimate kinase [Bacteriovorax sp.]|jgi:shikimate kinase
MGAGKSSLLRKFMPNNLGFDIIDLDHAVAADLNIRSERLGEWIMKNGFPMFRDKEKAKLKKLLYGPQDMVIALGGGSINQEILDSLNNNPDYYLVFLDIPLESCLARIKGDPERPLSQLPPDEMKKLYESRRKDYLQADLVLGEQEIKEIEGLGALVHNLLNKIP